jgi:hypothetical protein
MHVTGHQAHSQARRRAVVGAAHGGQGRRGQTRHPGGLHECVLLGSRSPPAGHGTLSTSLDLMLVLTTTLVHTHTQFWAGKCKSKFYAFNREQLVQLCTRIGLGYYNKRTTVEHMVTDIMDNKDVLNKPVPATLDPFLAAPVRSTKAPVTKKRPRSAMEAPASSSSSSSSSSASPVSLDSDDDRLMA